MAAGNLIQGLWVAQLIGQGALALVLIARAVWKDFPIFTAYSIFNLASGVTNYFLYQNPNLYFYVYWVGEGIAVILGLAVVYEVFRHLFTIHFALRKLANISFLVASVILFGLGCTVVYGNSGGLQTLSSGVRLAEEAARVLEVGLLMFLFLFSRAFGLHWRQPIFGVSIGLGIFTVVELIVVTVLFKLGTAPGDLLSLIRVLAYITSLLVWIGYLLAPERVPSAAELPKRAQLEQWNQAIMELINQ
jgi:hypothetical protein